MEDSDEMESYDTVQVFHKLGFDSAVGRNGFRSIRFDISDVSLQSHVGVKVSLSFCVLNSHSFLLLNHVL